MQVEVLLGHAVLEAVHDDVVVNPSREYVNPVHGGETDEVQLVLVAEFVLAAHGERGDGGPVSWRFSVGLPSRPWLRVLGQTLTG